MATIRIPRGDAGTIATLGHMRRLANRGVRHPLTVGLAGRIVEGAGGNRRAQARSLRSWLASTIEFQADPYRVELLRTVPEMLTEIRSRGFGAYDCDDVAILGAALGKAAGLPARFAVLGFLHPSFPYRHVYTELDGDGWVELDITRPLRLPPVARAMVMEV